MIHLQKNEKRMQTEKNKWFAWHEWSGADGWLLALGLLFCLVTMYYWDITVTARFSLVFIDSIFDGRFISFYDNAMASGMVPEGAVYDIGIYLIFAVWGLPVWILNKLFALEPMSMGSLLWFKFLLVLFLLGTIKRFRQIMEEMGFEGVTVRYAERIYLTSSVLIFPVLVSAQYDIIPLYFILLGTCFYLHGKNKLFLLCFAFAMTTKPFAALPVVALILLREKKISRILLQVCGSALPMLVLKGLYSFSEGYRESCGDFFTMMLPLLLDVSIEIGSVSVSLFMLGLIGVYIYCFARKESGDRQKDSRAAMLSLAVLWAVFCLFAKINPYWSVYLAPFLVMAVFMSKDRIDLALILDLVFQLAFTVVMVMKFTWVYGGSETFSYLLLKPLYGKLIGNGDSVTVAGMLRRLMIEDMLPLFGAAMTAGILAVLVLAAKGLGYEAVTERKPQIWHIRARIVFLYGWIGLCAAALMFGAMGY